MHGQLRPCSIWGINYGADYVTDLDKKVVAIAGALMLSDTSQLWDLYLKDDSSQPTLTVTPTVTPSPACPSI